MESVVSVTPSPMSMESYASYLSNSLSVVGLNIGMLVVFLLVLMLIIYFGTKIIKYFMFKYIAVIKEPGSEYVERIDSNFRDKFKPKDPTESKVPVKA